MSTLELFTDGSHKADHVGGWGCILRWGDKVREMYGGERDTTNNRMEMMAVIQGLSALTRDGVKVHITSDSQYVIKGCTEWRDGWVRRKMHNSNGEPVKNPDLWRELWALVDRHDVTWQWVKGHKGHPENERADALADMGVTWARQQ